MYELIQVTETAYYMDCPAKVGILRTAADEAVLIDSGSDRDAAKKVKKLLDAKGWRLKAILNTHSHADHIGGNQYLQAQTGCRIYAPGIEQDFTEHPVLEPSLLYGGFPPNELRTKFFLAGASRAEPLTEEALPEGVKLIPLPGHCFDMVGFRTADGAVFLADSLSSEETLQKYGITYLYDVKAYLETLEAIMRMEGKCFIPSHAAATEDIAPLARRNIDKVQEITQTLRELLTEPKTFDDLLSDVFTRFGLTMSLPQYALVGSTVRSYLAYLKNEGQIDCGIERNRLLWKNREG